MDTIEAFAKWTFNRPRTEVLAVAYGREYDPNDGYFLEKLEAVRDDAAGWYCTLGTEARARVQAAVEVYRQGQVAERVAPAPVPDPEPCSECGDRGWDVFDAGHHGLEIERCDGCGAFPDDDAATLAALRWWLADGSGMDSQDLEDNGLPHRGTVMMALLGSTVGLAIAALEPVVNR